MSGLVLEQMYNNIPMALGYDHSSWKKGSAGSWSVLAACISHASARNDFLDEALLSQLNGGASLFEANAKEAKDVTFRLQREIIAEVLQLANTLFNEGVVRGEPNLVVAGVEHHDLQLFMDEQTRV